MKAFIISSLTYLIGVSLDIGSCIIGLAQGLYEQNQFLYKLMQMQLWGFWESGLALFFVCGNYFLAKRSKNIIVQWLYYSMSWFIIFIGIGRFELGIHNLLLLR
jgi:hypothetical protein